jgi:hypothetical protein
LQAGKSKLTTRGEALAHLYSAALTAPLSFCHINIYKWLFKKLGNVLHCDTMAIRRDPPDDFIAWKNKELRSLLRQKRTSKVRKN